MLMQSLSLSPNPLPMFSTLHLNHTHETTRAMTLTTLPFPFSRSKVTQQYTPIKKRINGPQAGSLPEKNNRMPILRQDEAEGELKCLKRVLIKL